MCITHTLYIYTYLYFAEYKNVKREGEVLTTLSSTNVTSDSTNENHWGVI